MKLDGFTDLAIRSFNQRIERVSSSGGLAKPSLSPVELIRDPDHQSPALNLLAAKGTHVSGAQITIANGAFRITLTDVQIDDIGLEITENGVPQEHVGLGFKTIKWEWSEGNGASVAASYDLGSGQGEGAGDVGPNFVFFGPGVPAQPAAGETAFTRLTVGVTRPPSSAGGGAAKASFNALSMLTLAGKETITQLGAAVTGTHSPGIKANFKALDGNGQPYTSLRYSLVDASVTALVLSTTAGGIVQDKLDLDYQKIKWEGQPQGGGAGTIAGWNVANNTEF